MGCLLDGEAYAGFSGCSAIQMLMRPNIVANGGLNASNGMSVTRETVRSSLTSGGTADITVAGHTQITAATIGTIDEEGNDLGNLNLTTGSLNFTNLRDIHQSSQTSGSISTSVGIGDNPLAEDGKGREMTVNTSNLTYSNTSEYSAGNSLATLGTGTITVGGTLLEESGELTEAGQGSDSPLAGLNRDTTDTTYELWDVERTEGNVDLQVDHRFFSEEGRQAIKNDFVDTGEFGQDIARSVNTVADSENLGFLDFWETLDNTAKGTQIKNALIRDPANADILSGLASENGDEYAQAMQQLANLAQSTFGVELTELNFYDGEGTTNTGLADNVLADIKGGTIMEGEGAGNMFIDGTDGADKKDMNNTLGHELIESVTAQIGGKNDAAQEDQATAFGSHFADRVDQAFEGGINATSTGAFTTSLINSNAVSTGTTAANAASGANIDNRMIHTRETEIINQRLAPDYVERQARKGNFITEEEAAELLTNQLLRRVNGEAQTSGDARENWDHEADRYLSGASKNDFLRDENGEIIYDRHGSITPLFGTNSIYQKMDDTIFAPNESELPLMEQPDLGVREMADYSIGRVTGAVEGLGDIAQGSIDFLKDPAGGVTNIIDGVTNLPESLENQADDYFQAVIENDWRAVGEMEGNYDSGMLLDVTGAAGTGKILGLLDETSVTPVPLRAVDEAPSSTVGNDLPPSLHNDAERGGSWLLTEDQYHLYVEGQPLVGRPDGQFMSPSKDMNDLINETGGNTQELSQRLSTDWAPDDKLIRIDVENPTDFNPRLPDDSMSGANDKFVPGGETGGGVREFATDPVPGERVWATPVSDHVVPPKSTSPKTDGGGDKSAPPLLDRNPDPDGMGATGDNNGVGTGAVSASNAVQLEKQLASQEQLSQLSEGGGTIISQPAKQADRIASQTGSNPENIQKVSSDARVTRDGQKIQTHSFRDSSTNELIEPKTIIDE